MADQVSKDSKLNATTSILNSYIKTHEAKEGTDTKPLSLDDICKSFKKIYGTIDDTLPSENRRVGLG